jgi:hypothetical protein
MNNLQYHTMQYGTARCCGDAHLEFWWDVVYGRLIYLCLFSGSLSGNCDITSKRGTTFYTTPFPLHEVYLQIILQLHSIGLQFEVLIV